MAAVSHSGRRFPAAASSSSTPTSGFGSQTAQPVRSSSNNNATTVIADCEDRRGRATTVDAPTKPNVRESIHRALLSAESLQRVNMKLLHDQDQAPDQARDFGGRIRRKPCAVVWPASVDDIVRVMLAVQTIRASCGRLVRVAARGNGHSVNGQAQAGDGVVIEMQSLREPAIGDVVREPGGGMYADVCAGRLWVEVLDAGLRQYGLAPRSWTDYLYLSVGGTLQNAGVGGQCFRHGPLISNVARLEIVTASGQLTACSPTLNPDLFYGSLGGLGQLGIITKARILLEPAPHMVRWIRLVYTNFDEFAGDQERLIAMADANIANGSANGLDRNIVGTGSSSSSSSWSGFDYLEGFVVTNSNDPINGWPTILFSDHCSRDSLPAASSSSSSSCKTSVKQSFDPRLIPPNSAGPVLYCMEIAKYYKSTDELTQLHQRIVELLRPLRFVKGLQFQIDVTYREFLDRVHTGEEKLRVAGLWEGSAHPWLCLFIPGSQIRAFDTLIFKNKLKKGVGGPMLVYPMLRSKWPRDGRCSAVIPDNEEVFYMVALLRFTSTGGGGGGKLATDGVEAEAMEMENEEVIRIARTAGIKLKRYLPHFSNKCRSARSTVESDYDKFDDDQWEEHFGSARWARFRDLKKQWDPHGILAPGQKMSAPSLSS